MTDADPERDTSELERQLGEFGLSSREVKSMLRRYTLEKIVAHLQFTIGRVNDSNQKPFKSPVAYLKRALEGITSLTRSRHQPRQRRPSSTA